MPSNGKAQKQEKDPVTQLNDIHTDCVYELIANQGPTPEERFTFKLMIDGKTFLGSGSTKKEAKAAAAVIALKHPAVNAKANKDKSQGGPKKNFYANKQVFSGKKATKEYNDKIAIYNEDSGGCQYNKDKKDCSFFLNSRCLQGKNCPNLHPEYSPGLQNSPSLFPQVPLNESLTWLQICDNYRHLRCPNVDCKFLHVSRADEEFYVANRRIPAHIVEQAVRKALAADKTPEISPCQRYLEGQCSWYSCPFRHVNRKEFSQEVLEMLYKHFAGRFTPREEYHMPSRRLLSSPGLDREPHVCGSHSNDLAREILREFPVGYENRFQDRLDYGNAKPQTDPNTFLTGMSNFMRDDNYRKEKELCDLRDELRKLHEENAMLKNSYRLRVTEEDNFSGRGRQRSDFHESEKMYREQLSRLRKENDEIWKMLHVIDEKRQDPFYPLKHNNMGNSVFLEDLSLDKRPDMRKQLPEMRNFDELLESGIQRMERQIRYKRLGIPTSLATPQCQAPPQAKQHFAKQRQPQKPPQARQHFAKQREPQKPVNDTSRMPGKNAQDKTRPFYHVNKKSNLAQPKKANQQQNKNAKKPNQQQKQNQNQKSFLPKQNVKNSDKKPVVMIGNTKQESLVKEQREVEPRKDPSIEKNPADGQTPTKEYVKAEELATAGNLELIEKQRAWANEESEFAEQDDSIQNEECDTALETADASNEYVKAEESAAACIGNANQESLVKEESEVEPRKNPCIEKNPADGQTPTNEYVKAEELATAGNLERIEKQRAWANEESEFTDQDDSIQNEECDTSLGTADASNEYVKAEESAAACIGNENQESLVKEQREVEPRKNPCIEKNPADGQHPQMNVKAEESATAGNLERIEKQRAWANEESEFTDQDDSIKNETADASNEKSADASNEKSES